MNNETQAVTVVEPEESQAIELAQSNETPQLQGKTAAQARIDAVSNVLHKAYEKAAMLDLTEEEVQRLTAPFPDEAFRTGAGGKENLIYIEHASLRDRLNEVLGVGKWAIIVRNRWAEPFVTFKGKEGSRVYADCVLLIRGAFAAEAIGDMSYFPSNEATNYGDAVEGAKSAALRRCAKDLGVGLQAWHKDFCEGWWSRQRGPQPRQDAPQRAPMTIGKPTPMARKKEAATDEDKVAFLDDVIPIRKKMEAYMIHRGVLKEGQKLEDTPLDKVPVGEAVHKVIERCLEWHEQQSDDVDPALKPEESSEVVIPEDAELVTGYVRMVKEKPTTKGGTNYSILIVQDMEDKEGGVWLGTFDDVDGNAAQTLERQEVNAWWQWDKSKKYRNLVKRGITPTA